MDILLKVRIDRSRLHYHISTSNNVSQDKNITYGLNDSFKNIWIKCHIWTPNLNMPKIKWGVAVEPTVITSIKLIADKLGRSLPFIINLINCMMFVGIISNLAKYFCSFLQFRFTLHWYLIPKYFETKSKYPSYEVTPTIYLFILFYWGFVALKHQNRSNRDSETKEIAEAQKMKQRGGIFETTGRGQKNKHN